jgi:hypothetical protein
MKRSAATTSARLPEQAVFVLDENLSGRSIVNGLRSRQIPVHPFTDYFDRGTDDHELIAGMHGRPDLYLISRDRDFRYKPDMAAALLRAGVGAFVLTSAGNKTGTQLVEIIVGAWNGIARFAAKTPRPFVAKVRANGTVERHDSPPSSPLL